MKTMRQSTLVVAITAVLNGVVGFAADEAVSAKAVTVISKTLEGTTALPGELRAYRSIDVYAKVSGFVESVRVDRASKVQKGELLATVTAPEMQAQIAEAMAKVPAVESQRAEVEARRAAAESTLSRLREAAKTPGVVAGNDIVLAEKAVEAETARLASIDKSVEAAKAPIAALQEMLRYLKVSAEFDGVITERFIHEGSLVGPASKGATPMFRLEQMDRLRLVVGVPETMAGSIRRGARVSFTVAAFPGEQFSGVVARPSFSMDAKTRTMPVELDVVNSNGRLTPGMYAEVAWSQGRGHSSLLVPPKAIKATTERIFVIRVNNGVAEWVDVRRGAAEGDLVEVMGNLKAGDRILERATDEIRPGMKVSVK
jgi:membrane fusion protein (multidrug efflux system)